MMECRLFLFFLKNKCVIFNKDKLNRMFLYINIQEKLLNVIRNKEIIDYIGNVIQL